MKYVPNRYSISGWFTHDGEVMSKNSIASMVNSIAPLSKTSPEKLEAIRAWGRERAVPAFGYPIGSEDPMQTKIGRHILSILKMPRLYCLCFVNRVLVIMFEDNTKIIENAFV